MTCNSAFTYRKVNKENYLMRHDTDNTRRGFKFSSTVQVYRPAVQLQSQVHRQAFSSRQLGVS